MTIEEAIEKEKSIAKSNHELVKSYHTDFNVYMRQEDACRERAEYHEQVAEWLEELQRLKEQEPCEDCISRAEVRRVLGNEVFELTKLYTVSPKDNPKLDAKIGGINWSLNTLMELPPVTPKGVTVTDFADKCRECGREKVLDKIRAEIEHLTYYWCEVNPRTVIDDVLQIIDKYKAEGEVKDG